MTTNDEMTNDKRGPSGPLFFVQKQLTNSSVGSSFLALTIDKTSAGPLLVAFVVCQTGPGRPARLSFEFCHSEPARQEAGFVICHLTLVSQRMWFLSFVSQEFVNCHLSYVICLLPSYVIAKRPYYLDAR